MRANAPQPRVRHPFMPTRIFSQQSSFPDFSIPPPILPNAGVAAAMYNNFPSAYQMMPPPVTAQNLNPYQPYNYFRPPQQAPVVQFASHQQAPTCFYPQQPSVTTPVSAGAINHHPAQASPPPPPPPVVASPTKSGGGSSFDRCDVACSGDANRLTSPPTSSVSSSTTTPMNKISKRSRVSLSSSSISPPASKIVKKTNCSVDDKTNTSAASVTDDDKNDDDESENAKNNITPTNQSSLSNNNRIFVDGRPYEVRFVQDKAVIERNGLPHQVTFVGKAKDVVIDGVPHKMNFGDEGLQITIDGRTLNIRFGAPSRELYIGSMPLRGSFGGPPIHFALNGVKHRAQLCGPPPEVKIDAEPSYELIRFLRPLNNAPAPFAPTPTQTSNVANYGYSSYTPPRPLAAPPVFARPVATANAARVSAPVAIDQQLLMSVLRTLPRPQGIDLVEQRPCPLSTLTDFNLNLLRIRYKSVINALYFDKSLQCDTCAERFNDEELYTLHLDHHSRIDQLGSHCTTAKTWFSTAQDWVQFQTEQDSIDQVVKTEIDADENGMEENEDDKEKIQAGICLDEQYQNTYCAVCGDKFEQIWDEEDESWKFSNAVTVNDKVYHTFCRGEEQDSPRPEDDEIQASSSENSAIKNEPPQDEADGEISATSFNAAGPPTTIPLLGSTNVDAALLNSVLSAVKNLPPLIKRETPAPTTAELSTTTTTPPVLIQNFDSIMNALRTLNSGRKTAAANDVAAATANHFDPNRVKIEAEDYSIDEREKSVVVKSEPE